MSDDEGGKSKETAEEMIDRLRGYAGMHPGQERVHFGATCIDGKEMLIEHHEKTPWSSSVTRMPQRIASRAK